MKYAPNRSQRIALEGIASGVKLYLYYVHPTTFAALRRRGLLERDGLAAGYVLTYKGWALAKRVIRDRDKRQRAR